MKIKIYSGLSLGKSIIHKYLPNAIVAEPIEREQIYSDIKNRVNVIGIIDGKFLQSLAASPTEILDAIRCGIKVYGSSSLGALRGVELESFGMIGCGKIFEFIRSRNYFRDDQVGQSFLDQVENSQTLPYIDLHFLLDEMLEKKKISKSIANIILKVYGKIYFANRNWQELANELRLQYPQMEWATTIQFLSKVEKNQKTKDGIELLKRIRRDQKRIQILNRNLY